MNAAALLLALTALAPLDRPSKPSVTGDVVYGHKAGMALTYDVLRPSEANGAGVVYLVSGGWFSFYFNPESITRLPNVGGRFEALLDAGFTLFLVRHGSAPWFKVPDAVRDVESAIRHVRANATSYGVDPERLGALGDSAGGHLALILGTQGKDGLENGRRPESRAGSRVRTVVANFAPVDLRDFVGPSERFPALDFEQDKAPGVSPILSATSDDAPTLLLHGTKDHLVPLSQSERMRDALQEVGVEVELVIYEGAGHGFKNEFRGLATTATVAWFESHLLGD
jgi:acetyl esterase/lipase